MRNWLRRLDQENVRITKKALLYLVMLIGIAVVFDQIMRHYTHLYH